MICSDTLKETMTPFLSVVKIGEWRKLSSAWGVCGENRRNHGQNGSFGNSLSPDWRM